MRHLARYLTLALGAVVVIPLYLYDHSGISMSAGAPNPFDNPRVATDEFGQGLGWTRRWSASSSRRASGSSNYAAKGRTARSTARTTGRARRSPGSRSSYKTRSSYTTATLQGEVYGWHVEDADGETVEGCGGYLPDVSVPHAGRT